VGGVEVGVIEQLTPYMKSYSEEFSDAGNINWLPYLMYFHPFDHRSGVVNTDSSGFRFSIYQDTPVSVKNSDGIEEVSIIAGSSTVFGIGASSDDHTLASYLSKHDHEMCWLNFGGRSYNSTQEMMLFSLYRDKLPKIRKIVLFSGFNDLGLSRLPENLRLEHGAFFMCSDFFDAMRKTRQSIIKKWRSQTKIDEAKSRDLPSLKEQIDFAASLTIRNLSNWKAFADDMDAELIFVLQPLANWVRRKGSVQEEAIFDDLEKKGHFEEIYGDILSKGSYQTYRDRLSDDVEALGVRFLDMTSLLKSRVKPDDWLFVDRIHFTDRGHELVSKIILENL
jgi:hypothetical protein